MNDVEKNSVLIVDDDKSNIIALTHILTPEYTVYAAKSGKDAIEVAKEHSPDVILLDIVMPEMDGFEVLSKLKNIAETREIPVLFITGLRTAADEEKGLRLGAADFISKPFSPAIVKLRIMNQLQMLNQIDMIRHLSITDQLTDLPNRRSFDQRFSLEWNHAMRNKMPLSIFLLDIDFFKIYNDTYGHLQGDEALRTVPKVIMKPLHRSNDFLARWGGEEFVVLLPGTASDGAMEVAEQIRAGVEKMRIPCEKEGAEKITISIGVNTLLPRPENSSSDFIDGADRALYEAKRTGRNRVCKYEGENYE
jgi:diguanylate cyclase (GGDEF)-like protein